MAVTKKTTFSEPELTSEMIAGNYSTLKITINFSANNNVTYFSGKTLKCICNGETQTKSVSLTAGGSVTKTFTFTDIGHNDDGTKDVSWSWSISTGTSVLGTLKDSGTRTLQTIPRTSKLSVPEGTHYFDERIELSVKSQTYTKNIVTYSVFGQQVGSYDLGYSIPNQIKTKNLYFPVNLISNIPNGTSATATVTCKTTFAIEGSPIPESDIGTTTLEIPLQVRDNIIPTARVGTLAEANSTMLSFDPRWNIYVQNHSQLSIPITAEGILGSKIEAIKVTTNEQTLTYTFDNPTTSASHTFTTNLLKSSGTNTISVEVTDTRKRKGTASTTYSVTAYSAPTINTSSSVSRTSSGTTGQDNLTYTFVGNSNNIGRNASQTTFKVGYKLKDASTYTYISSETQTGSSSINRSNKTVSTPTFSSDSTYDIQFYVKDAFNEVTLDKELETEGDLMNFNTNGKAMAIGKVSEAGSNEELLEIALPTIHTEDIYFKELDMFNDTSGSDWQAMMRNKIDYCIDNINTSKESTSAFINGGWSGVNYGFGIFSKIGTVYQLKWFSSNSTYYVRKIGSSYSYYNENDVDFFRANSIEATNGIYSKVAGNVGTPTGGSNLVIKRANNSEAPNNGVVLEFGNSTNWVGQLYIGDNATQGVYYNGWSNGVRGSWRKLAWEPVSLYDNSSGSNASITLSETSSNFAYLEIFYRTNDDYRSSKKIYSPNDKKVILDASIISGNYTYVKSAQYSISGTSISLESNLSGQARIGNNVATTWNKDSNRLYIEKVIGYRW